MTLWCRAAYGKRLIRVDCQGSYERDSIERRITADIAAIATIGFGPNAGGSAAGGGGPYIEPFGVPGGDLAG